MCSFQYVLYKTPKFQVAIHSKQIEVIKLQDWQKSFWVCLHLYLALATCNCVAQTDDNSTVDV